MSGINEFVKQLLLDNYDLGAVATVCEIQAGDTNHSFSAVCEKEGIEKRWYIRQYNPIIKEEDIIYEHEFEKYLNERIDDGTQTLCPVQARSGRTWVAAECNGQSNFYAVFHIICGREPYSWEYNDLTDIALDSCAEIVAKFHSWAYGFEERKEWERREAGLLEQFQNWRIDFPEMVKRMQADRQVFRRYIDYIEKEQEFLMHTITFCEEELSKHMSGLKRCISHRDLNPGNLMFDENDKVSAVFDLDWVKTDFRLYDIACMAYQATASWETSSWGEVPFDRLGRFVGIYNDTMKKYGTPLGELNEEERRFLPVMMIISAVKVIMDFCCYENHEGDIHRVFVNSWRFVDSVHYMLKHLDEMTEAVK